MCGIARAISLKQQKAALPYYGAKIHDDQMWVFDCKLSLHIWKTAGRSSQKWTGGRHNIFLLFTDS